MPSTYAHRRFGANVLDHLPAPLREKLEAHRELYDIGLHGPDLLFYYHAEKSTPVAALELAERYQVEMPIVQTVNAIVNEGMGAAEAVRTLMDRDPKNELPKGYEK